MNNFGSWQGGVKLWKAALEANARSEAFAFAMRCQGNVECIENELSEREETREFWFSRPFDDPRNTNPMTPGAGPRIYSDSYVAALREALEIIRDASD